MVSDRLELLVRDECGARATSRGGGPVQAELALDEEGLCCTL